MVEPKKMKVTELRAEAGCLRAAGQDAAQYAAQGAIARTEVERLHAAHNATQCEYQTLLRSLGLDGNDVTYK